MLTIERGRIIIYRIFDAAMEIDLSMVESNAREGTRRLRISKYPYMKALEFTNPPVSFELPGFTISLFDREIEVSVIAKAYNFGALSIALTISVPEGTPLSLLEAVAKELDSEETIDKRAKDYIVQLIQNLGSAVKDPELKEEFVEDYTVFMIERFNKKLDAEELLKEYDPSRLLLYETRELSEYTITETLKHRFSYYPDDLVIVHLDNAFVLEPSGSSDIFDLLEFANAQILELRYYDNLLDKQLSWIYKELSKRRTASSFRLRDYERLAKKITETLADLTEVTEKVDNALKVTEDVYYARIYRTAMMLFRSGDWQRSIKEKLGVVTNTAKMIYEEISTKRGHLLELGIIILIIAEIILLMVIEW